MRCRSGGGMIILMSSRSGNSASVLRVLIPLAGVLVAMTLGAGTASAVTVTGYDESELFDTNAFLPEDAIAFTAEGRIGGASTFELGLKRLTSQPGGAQAEFDWPDLEPVPFSLSYSASANEATYVVGEGSEAVTLAFTPDRPFNDILVRASALHEGQSSLVDELVLQVGGQTIGIVEAAFSEGPRPGGFFEAGVVTIEDVGFQDFVLEGRSIFGLTGDSSLDRQSRIAYQIKVGKELEPIPEPTTVALALVVGAIGIRRRRRRSR